MKILLLDENSHDSQGLAQVSLHNHWLYSSLNYYDHLTIREDWTTALEVGYGHLLKLLPLYDVIMSVGSDVLFTNFNTKIEDIIQPGDSIVLSEETAGWPSKVNNGVALYCNTPFTLKFARLLTEKHDEWISKRLIMQSWINENLEHPTVKNALRTVPTRVMNSTYRKGKEDWQPGDWLVHFYGRPQNTKMGVMMEFLNHHRELR
jgi:hypothetical protein